MVHMYWVPQKLPQIYTVIAHICIGRLRDLQYMFAVSYETFYIIYLIIIMVSESYYKSLCAEFAIKNP